MRGKAKVFVSVPPERLWEMLADVTRMGEWSPECIRCEWLDGATGPAVGVRFQGWNRLPFVGTWRSTSTIVTCVPGRALAWVVGKDPADPNTRWEYDLSPIGFGTELTERYEMLREPWIVLAYYRLVGRSGRLAHSMDETLQRLKDHAEQLHPPQR